MKPTVMSFAAKPFAGIIQNEFQLNVSIDGNYMINFKTIFLEIINFFSINICLIVR